MTASGRLCTDLDGGRCWRQLDVVVVVGDVHSVVCCLTRLASRLAALENEVSGARWGVARCGRGGVGVAGVDADEDEGRRNRRW